MTHRNGHQDGDRYSRKQQFTGNRPRNENNQLHQQHQQYQNWDRDYTRRPNPDHQIARGYDEETSRSFGPSYGSSDYYGRNLDSERGLYVGDPNPQYAYSANRQYYVPESDSTEPRYYMTRSREPMPSIEHEARMQNQRFANADWSGYGYGDQDQPGRVPRSSRGATYDNPDFAIGHDYQMRNQGDYFSQPYMADNIGREMGYRGKGPKGYVRSDERLKEDISERLADDYFIDASDIEVQSKDGLVTLNGTVNSRQLKYRAEDIVEHCHGVKDIDNRLKIKTPLASEQRMGSASQNAPGSQGNKKQ